MREQKKMKKTRMIKSKEEILEFILCQAVVIRITPRFSYIVLSWMEQLFYWNTIVRRDLICIKDWKLNYRLELSKREWKNVLNERSYCSHVARIRWFDGLQIESAVIWFLHHFLVIFIGCFSRQFFCKPPHFQEDRQK